MDYDDQDPKFDVDGVDSQFDKASIENEMLTMAKYIKELEIRNTELEKQLDAQKSLSQLLQNSLIQETKTPKKRVRTLTIDQKAKVAYYQQHKYDTQIITMLEEKLTKSGITYTRIPWQMVKTHTDLQYDKMTLEEREQFIVVHVLPPT